MEDLFVNKQELMILRTKLEELCHQQPPNFFDNLTASGITNNYQTAKISINVHAVLLGQR